jgi:2-dehydro-3-deoxy-D-gluconate 5-dehydrogenase
MKSLFDLQGRVAIVTGGNGGIGLGMAKGLAQAGASVVVAGRDKAKNEQAVAQLEEAGSRASAMAHAVDVTQEAACAQLIQATIARFGRLDILVNNAGTNLRKSPQDYSLDEWNTLIDTNLTSAFLCSRAAYAPMVAQGGGKIINIGSMTSIFGASFAAPYSATKGGIVQFTKAIAVAWAKDNIQANAILPGWIDTALTVQARKDVEGLHERVVGRTPAGRWGVPGDFAGVAVFLAGAASDFVTGAAIPVDGGYSSQG